MNLSLNRLKMIVDCHKRALTLIRAPYNLHFFFSLIILDWKGEMTFGLVERLSQIIQRLVIKRFENRFGRDGIIDN